MEVRHKVKAKAGGDRSGLREIISTTVDGSSDSQPTAKIQEPPRRLHRKKVGLHDDRDRLTYHKAEALVATIRAAWEAHGIQAKAWIEVIDHRHGEPEFSIRSTLALRCPKPGDAA